MPCVRATVHVTSPQGGPSSRPAPDRVKQAAESLRRLGFVVLGAGRFGVSIQADALHFKEALGVTPAESAGAQAVAPRDTSLIDLVDYLEVMTPSSLADS